MPRPFTISGRRSKRKCADLLADLVDRVIIGDKLVALRHIDAEVTRPQERGRADAHVHLFCACVFQHVHNLVARRAAHDGVIDEDDALILDNLAQDI